MDDEENTNTIELHRTPIIISSEKSTPLQDESVSGKMNFFSPQVISVLILSSTMTHAGVSLAFPNLLRKEFSTDSVATYASISALATPIGTFLSGLFNDRIGRKKTMIVLKCLSIFTWFLTTLLRNPVFFYGSSIFSGLTRGALTATCPAYIAEISQGDYRQQFLSLLTLFFMVGTFFVTTTNELLQWHTAALCYVAFFALLLALIVFFVPESPHWLAIIKLDTRRAKVELRRLNPHEKAFNKEWKLIMKKQETITNTPSLLNKLAMIQKPKVYKPFILLLILIFFQQFCGTYPMSGLTVYVIPKVGNKLGQQYNSEIFFIIGIVRLIPTIVATLCLAKINQKQLLLISFVGMLASALPVFCLRLIFPESADTIQPMDWIMLILLTIYICTSSVGIMGVPWTIISELLPTEVRGLLGPFLVTVGYVTMSGHLKIFPFILNTVSIVVIFVYFTVLSLIGLIFVYVYVPETRGKSLLEIEKLFTKTEKKNGISINTP